MIASIHQPSTSTFQLFDKLLLLSEGATLYNGPVTEMQDYFASVQHPLPTYANPAEFLLSLANVDFAYDQDMARNTLHQLISAWKARSESQISHWDLRSGEQANVMGMLHKDDKPNQFIVPLILMHRSFIKSYRDIFAYGIRIGMSVVPHFNGRYLTDLSCARYMGLAILMGTVWLRLSDSQDDIQSYINAIFFGGAFM